MLKKKTKQKKQEKIFGCVLTRIVYKIVKKNCKNSARKCFISPKYPKIVPGKTGPPFTGACALPNRLID